MKLKAILSDGTSTFIPESNLLKFKQIHFNELVSIIPPDENGEYPGETFATSSTGAAIDGYRKENESLGEENERLTELNEKIISENEVLTQSNSDQAFEINRLKDVNEKLSAENTELKTEITALNFTIEELQPKTITENTNPGAEPSKGKSGPKSKAVNAA